MATTTTDSSNGGIMIKPEVLDGQRSPLSEEARRPGLDWSSVTCGRGHLSHSDRFAITPLAQRARIRWPQFRTALGI